MSINFGNIFYRAARFGYRLSGKLARLAAQDKLELSKLNARKVNEIQPKATSS
jgi:hypothetical protein